MTIAGFYWGWGERAAGRSDVWYTASSSLAPESSDGGSPCFNTFHLGWQASPSGDLVDVKSSPSRFDTDPKTGRICKSGDANLCVGVNKSSTPKDSDSITMQDISGMSKDRLTNFIWNQYLFNEGDTDICKASDANLTAWCLTANPHMCIDYTHSLSSGDCSSSPGHHLHIHSVHGDELPAGALFAISGGDVLECTK